MTKKESFNKALRAGVFTSIVLVGGAGMTVSSDVNAAGFTSNAASQGEVSDSTARVDLSKVGDSVSGLWSKAKEVATDVVDAGVDVAGDLTEKPPAMSAKDSAKLDAEQAAFETAFQVSYDETYKASFEVDYKRSYQDLLKSMGATSTKKAAHASFLSAYDKVVSEPAYRDKYEHALAAELVGRSVVLEQGSKQEQQPKIEKQPKNEKHSVFKVIAVAGSALVSGANNLVDYGDKILNDRAEKSAEKEREAERLKQNLVETNQARGVDAEQDLDS